MLLTRDEMSFDFGGARLDPARDRKLLGFVFNQFLYGEVTGIQVGHWLYQAPDLDAARFLARQSLEEMQHVDNFLRILTLLDCAPAKAHPAIRFLSTGMMGQSWAEHVALEMAQGEGLVLMALYALIDTLDHPEVVQILERAVRQEERHVEFGERRTIQALSERPGLRPRLLGLALVSILAVRELARHMHRFVDTGHPVMRPLAEIGLAQRARLIAHAYASKAFDGLRPNLRRPRRLTDVYLSDPEVAAVVAETRRAPLGHAAE
jgi:bacterioferritin (cytochrome b1)